MGVENAPYDEAQIVVLPVPYEGAVCFTAGTAKAPAAIIRASGILDFWDEELLWEPGLQLKFHTLADLDPEPGEVVESFHRRIEEKAAGLRGRDVFFLTIGGDHSITAPVIRGLTSRPDKVTVVQIDAHQDLLDEFMGSPLSHACVMRRLWDEGARIIQIGIRTLDRSEYELSRDSDRIETYYMHQLQRESENARLAERLRGLTGDVYLTMDVDGLDGAIIPGTGTPQPGGLGWYQTLGFLRALLLESSANVIGADVVETIPLDQVPITEVNAAKLAFKAISYYFYRRLHGPRP
jgi:agmatinase